MFHARRSRVREAPVAKAGQIHYVSRLRLPAPQTAVPRSASIQADQRIMQAWVVVHPDDEQIMQERGTVVPEK